MTAETRKQHNITRETISDAHDRIRPYVVRTPVISSSFINDLAGCEVFFKCENLQHIGAFKARGAMNAALSLSAEELEKGIATHSSGNHAQAIARAARILNTEALIVMPKTAPAIKKRGVLELGGKIFECEPTLEARESTLREVIQRTGATEIHPFNNYDVIAGQATAAKELFEEQEIDYLVAPVGGGGLISGTCLAALHFSPNTRVIAAEPEGADDAYRSLKTGNIERSQAQSIADGLLTSLGDKTFPIIREHISQIITVSDTETIAAMKTSWERLKLLVETSGAVPLGAVIKSKSLFEGKRIGIIISGGNVDLERAFDLFNPLKVK